MCFFSSITNWTFDIFSFDAAQVAFRRALEDSIDTPSAMSALRNLISSCNIYMNQNPSSIDGLLILGISRWITQMLQMFGVCTYDESRIGWEMEASMTQQTTVRATRTPSVDLLMLLTSDHAASVSPGRLNVPRQGQNHCQKQVTADGEGAAGLMR